MMNLAELHKIDLLIAANLQRLMQHENISEAELARKTNIPQPTLHKILSGKTNDPRASTLKSLSDYFRISIDELLTGVAIDKVSKGNINSQSIAIISWNDCVDAINFRKKLTPNNWNAWITSEFTSINSYALISKPSMEPRIFKGSILIINPDLAPEDGDLVVVHYPDTKEATLREISIDGPVTQLLPISTKSAPDKLDSTIKILGVLVKSIYSFHN